RVAEQRDYAPSHAQKRLWLSSQTREGSVALNMAGAYYLSGQLDVALLDRVFALIVERHESLRTVFATSGGELRQRILSPAEFGFSLRTHVKVTDLMSEPFDLTRGPLFAVHLFTVAPGRWMLLLKMHHIIGDAWS